MKNRNNKGTKKLVYILNHYSNNSAQHFYHVVHLLECMAKLGIKIILIIEKADDVPVIENPNIEVMVQKEKGKLGRVLELNRMLSDVQKRGYDHIFIRISTNAGIIAIHSAKIHGGISYYWQSGDNFTYDRKLRGFAKIRWLIKDYSKIWYIKNNVDYFVTGPETMVDYYVRELGVDRGKMLCLYNDIDTERFSAGTEKDRIALRRELNLPQEAKIILFVHRLSPIKRFANAIPYVVEKDKFRESQAFLIVIGTGPDEEKIKVQIKNSAYKDRVIMLGAKPNQEVQKFYKGADIFINPSYSEGFPRVVIEAMATGLPVVVTNVGGTKDILPEEELEYLVDKDDMDIFSDKILELVSRPDKCESLSKINLKFVKKYSTEVIAKMYEEAIFEEDNS